MRAPHSSPRPTAPRARAPRAGWPLAVIAIAPLLLAGCTDDIAAKCPALAHPPVLTVAAASDNPCAAKKGEPAQLLALRVVRTYQRTTALAGNLPTRFPLRCGNTRGGYLHLLDALAKGQHDHGDPVNDPAFDALIAYTVDHGTPFDQGNTTGGSVSGSTMPRVPATMVTGASGSSWPRTRLRSPRRPGGQMDCRWAS